MRCPSCNRKYNSSISVCLACNEPLVPEDGEEELGSGATLERDAEERIAENEGFASRAEGDDASDNRAEAGGLSDAERLAAKVARSPQAVAMRRRLPGLVGTEPRPQMFLMASQRRRRIKQRDNAKEGDGLFGEETAKRLIAEEERRQGCGIKIGRVGKRILIIWFVTFIAMLLMEYFL